MPTTEIVPRNEDRLHSYVVFAALEVNVGKSCKSPHRHAKGQIQPTDSDWKHRFVRGIGSRQWKSRMSPVAFR
jgi:hypothetical protein